MKNIAAIVPVLMLVLLAGCPGRPQAAGAPPDTGMATAGAVCETLLPADSGAMIAAAESAAPLPPPEPDPESLPEPEVLPRMWDYGSEKCIPCKEMEKILTPMMAEYEGRVDIRIINVYEEQKMAADAVIQVIPTQVFYDPEGNELFRHVGVYPRDSIVEKFREFGFTD